MNNYIFSANFKDKNGNNDFLWFGMNTPNYNRVKQLVPEGATDIDIFLFESLPKGVKLDILETA